MLKKGLIAVIIIGIMFLSGCEGGGGEAGGAPRVPFITGTNGLLIEFEEGSPPAEVTDDGSFGFQVLVKLQNDGEFNVDKNKVKVSLVGIDPNDFGTSLGELKDKYPEDDLLAKRRDAEGNFIEGTTTFITFPSEFDELVPRQLTGNTPFTFRADVCYMYETQAVSQMCVLRDLINRDDDAICDPSEGKPIYSSAGPVQVGNFRQSVGGKDRITFNFDITHSNNGEVLKFGDGYDGAHCPKDPRERRAAENKVKVHVEIPGMSNLRCVGLSGGSTNDGYVLLSGGSRSVSCTVDLPTDRSDYTKEVLITLQYNYEDFKETEVLVKHLAD